MAVIDWYNRLMKTTQIQDLLRERRLKVTEARVMVLSALENIAKPADVTELIASLNKGGKKVDQATVYRTLDLLVKVKLVELIDFRDGKYRYELQKKHHHHLVCEECGSVDEVEGDLMKFDERKIESVKKFLIKSHSLEFFGLCRKCR